MFFIKAEEQGAQSGDQASAAMAMAVKKTIEETR